MGLTADVELMNLQWAVVDYDHLRTVWIKRGEPQDHHKAWEAWRTLERAWISFQDTSDLGPTPRQPKPSPGSMG
jgi:hypothetical protein